MYRPVFSSGTSRRYQHARLVFEKKRKQESGNLVVGSLRPPAHLCGSVLIFHVSTKPAAGRCVGAAFRGCLGWEWRQEMGRYSDSRWALKKSYVIVFVGNVKKIWIYVELCQEMTEQTMLRIKVIQVWLRKLSIHFRNPRKQTCRMAPTRPSESVRKIVSQQ